MNYIFDLDDTLYDISIPFQKSYEKVFGKQYDLDPLKLFYLFRSHGDEVFELSERKEITMEEMYIYRLSTAFLDFDISITPTIALKFQEEYQQFQENIELSSSMIFLLDYLKEKKHFLGIITNGPSSHQRDKINALKLNKWFSQDKIFISSEIGYSKPDIQIFQKYQEKFQLELAKTYYIGDSFTHDMIGAQQAGFKTIWFNHRLREKKQDISLNYEAQSFEKLKNILLQIEKNEED